MFESNSLNKSSCPMDFNSEKSGDPMLEVAEKSDCPTLICTGPTCLINIARSLKQKRHKMWYNECHGDSHPKFVNHKLVTSPTCTCKIANNS